MFLEDRRAKVAKMSPGPFLHKGKFFDGVGRSVKLSLSLFRRAHKTSSVARPETNCVKNGPKVKKCLNAAQQGLDCCKTAEPSLFP